jgi:hypothetical protein
MNLVLDLEVTRVDLVDEGANSEAFIKLYKRKETTKSMNYDEILASLKPEHAQVVRDVVAKAKTEAEKIAADDIAKAKAEAEVEINKAKEDISKAKEEADAMKLKLKAVEDAEKEDTPEEVMKSLPENVQAVFKSLKAKADAADEEIKKAKETKLQDEAIAKAKELKSIPVEEAKLVAIVKGASPELIEVLKAANAAIENSTTFDEFGKSKKGGSDAWTEIEKKAAEIEVRDKVSKAKAIAVAIKENPDLYRTYVNGGAN